MHRCLALSFVLLSLAAISAISCIDSDNPALGETDQEVIGGTFEKDYLYPWTFNVGGANNCQAVLIHPEWILTAAHCLPASTSTTIAYSRTDPFTGVLYSGEVTVTQADMHTHPLWQQTGTFQNDIALVHVPPFDINRYVQTVALPSTAMVYGQTGAEASYQANGPRPPDSLKVFRAPSAESGCGDTAKQFCATAPTASLCGGDSGGGFVRNVGASLSSNGRATVLGIAVAGGADDADCLAGVLGEDATFVDVSQVIDTPNPSNSSDLPDDFIFATTGLSRAAFAGNARFKWSGQSSSGYMHLGCMWNVPPLIEAEHSVGPMNVPGVELRRSCNYYSGSIRAYCVVPSSTGLVITTFKVTKTDPATGATTTTTLASNVNYATYDTPANQLSYIWAFDCKVGVPPPPNG